MSDYTKLIANGLAAAGDDVHVWCPPEHEAGGTRQEAESERQEADGRRQVADVQNGDSSLVIHDSSLVTVHRELGRFRPSDLRRVGKQLDQFSAPRRLLVQWVPHGYGYRSMNLPFCFWLWRRAKLSRDRVEIMVHEPFLSFSEGSRRQDLAAAVHRLMVTLLLQAANQIWVSIPDWERQLRPFVLGKRKSFAWLPLPSTIPLLADPDGVAAVRAQYADPDTRLVGHFGAYDPYMTDLMLELLPSLVNGHDNLSVMLLGKGGLELRHRLIELHPELSETVSATGALSPADVSRHISACDVMLQPYADGVSGRRTSVMTGLSHGVSVVTTKGKATECCWTESKAVKLTGVDDVSALLEATRSLLADEMERCRLGIAGRTLYEEQFNLSHIVAALRKSAMPSLAKLA